MFKKKNLVNSIPNSKYLIETVDGFRPFAGVAKLNIVGGFEFFLENGTSFKVASDHGFKIRTKTVSASDILVGDVLHGSTVERIDTLHGESIMYDIIGVDNESHSYIADGINNANCSFIGSSKTLLDSNILENYEWDEPIRVETMVVDNDLWIWEEPVPDVQYILGVDVGKGVGGDYSVIQVIRINNAHDLEQVARYHSNTTSLDDFSQIVISISKYYGRAEIMLENNDYGHIVAHKIWDVHEYDEIVNYEKEILGVRSDKKKKAVGNAALREYTDNRWINIRDRLTWEELCTYEEIRTGIFQAIPGCHDDLVASLFWTLYYIKSSLEFDESADTQINPRFNLHTRGFNRLEQQENQLMGNPGFDKPNRELREADYLNGIDEDGGDDDLVGDWMDAI